MPQEEGKGTQGNCSYLSPWNRKEPLGGDAHRTAESENHHPFLLSSSTSSQHEECLFLQEPTAISQHPEHAKHA